MKRSQIFAIAVLSTFIFVSCGETDSEKVSKSPSDSPISGMEVPMPERRFDEVVKDYKSEYLNTAEAQQCLVQSVHSCVGQTVNRKAMATSDVEICEDFSDATLQKNCKSMVIMSAVQKNGDPKGCEALDGMDKNQCILQAYGVKARTAKNPTLCSEIAKALPVEKSGSGSPVPDPLGWSEPALKTAIANCQIQTLMESAKDPKDCGIIEEKPLRDSCEQSVKMRMQAALPLATPPEMTSETSAKK